MTSIFEPIAWSNGMVRFLDQRLLPASEVYIDCHSIEDVYTAIKDMVVRGAPCIGFSGIFGLALWVRQQNLLNSSNVKQASEYLRSARPTAVNLMYEVDRCTELILAGVAAGKSGEEVSQQLVKLGEAEIASLANKNTFMAQTGLAALEEIYGKKKLNIMTHCNTGVLACGCIGTALGVISYSHTQGRVNQVWVDETRPYMQGTRLTAFELSKEKIPYQIVVEGSASNLMRGGNVDAIFVGADRIAANGDTANKVGTSTLAIVAKHYKVPFYVVAPLSSFDWSIRSGDDIEIELRDENEILMSAGKMLAPVGARARNPSFDVTAAEHISGIICEKGIVKNPNIETMKYFLGK